MTIVDYPGTTTDWAQWHQQCEHRLHGPRGTSGPIDRHWIGEEPQELPGVPGTWWVVEGRVFVAAKPGDRLDHEGGRIGGILILDPAEGRAGLLLRHDNRALEVARHNGLAAVHVYAPTDLT